MAKFKSVRGPSRKRPAVTVVQSKIENYFNLTATKSDETDNLESTLQDLMINSPKSKKFKFDTSKTPPRNTTPPRAKSNQNIIPKCFTSPARSRNLSVSSNIKSPKNSSSKSARCLFNAPSPRSSKRTNAAKVDQASLKSLDVNANLSTSIITKVSVNLRKRISPGSDSFKGSFVATDPVANSSKRTDCVKTEKPEKPMEVATSSKLVASETFDFGNCAESDQSEGLSFFKEIDSYLQAVYFNPQTRLRANFIGDSTNDIPENLKRGCERDVYTESLMAVLQVHGFSDTALDLMRNYLSNKQFLSWKLIRSILYHSISCCNEDDFKKSLNLCLDQILLHPPGALNMRDYYLTLLNVDDENTFDEVPQKGLLNYLMEAFSNFYKYSTDSKPKRTVKKNTKYFNNSYLEKVSDDEEDEDEAIEAPVSPPKKSRGRPPRKGKSAVSDEDQAQPARRGKKKTKQEEEKKFLEDEYLASLDYNAKHYKSINDTICSVYSNIGRKSDVVVSGESLIDRQFQLFDFVLNVLENDFVQWNKKNRFNLRERLVSTEGTPLVASVMWDRQIGFSSCSTRMKEIFHFYSFAEPKHRKYFERLVALLAEITIIFEEHIEDWDDGNRLIKYPFLAEKCRSFTKELFFHSFKASADNAVSEEQIACLKSLRPSWLKLFVANRLLERSFEAKLSGNLTSVIEVLRSQTFDDAPTNQKSLHKSLVRVAQPDTQLPQPQSQYSKLRSVKVVNAVINKKGETNIHWACSKKKPGELKKYLQSPTVDIFLQDNNKWLPIHDAASSGSLECCKLLYNYASTFEERCFLMTCRGGSNSSTPLMEAVVMDHVEVADYLLSVGGSILLKHINSNEESVFHLCKSEQMEKVLNKYKDDAVKKYLRIPSQVWDILFALISAYFETYGTRLCKKFKHLNLDPSNFHNIDLPTKSGCACFQIDSSHYIRDLSLIRSLSELVDSLKETNPDLLQLKLLDAIVN